MREDTLNDETWGKEEQYTHAALHFHAGKARHHSRNVSARNGCRPAAGLCWRQGAVHQCNKKRAPRGARFRV